MEGKYYEKMCCLLIITLILTSSTTRLAKAEEYQDSVPVTALSAESILLLKKGMGIDISENSYIKLVSILDNKTLETYSTVAITTPLRDNYYQQTILMFGNEYRLLDIELRENGSGQKKLLVNFSRRY